MSSKKAVLVLAAMWIALPFATKADGRAEIRALCAADVKANCGTVFSRDKAIACLIENKSKLSAPCSSALTKASCDARAPGNLRAAFTCPG